ncbi:unnamed protein product [Schistocephalus solidus]|uniref:WD_REPEATS_REGION domain-containing protein n=1 Tax=Schistocephalus solidus TaxID=70667 RepID=A0A3P7DAG1_SCHSO|nr:unnamed protein product [Schistocephalus solidus]
MSAIGDGMTVVCGFDSGLMSAVDLRSGQVLALWCSHSDAVSQICTHQSGWFVSSSPDRSIAFWRLHGGTLDCFRSFVHTRAASGSCSPDVLRNLQHATETSQSSPPNRTMSVSSLVALAPQGSSLVVAGPSAASLQNPLETLAKTGGGTSAATAASSSLLSSSAPSASNGIGSLSGLPGSCLGAYRPSSLRELDFHWLGHVGPELLRGQLTALSVLPESQSFLVGSASGALSLLY